MSAVGFGRKSQDWSYLTPLRALWVQTANIVQPQNIPSMGIIDTTLDRAGKPIERARNQTLAIYAIVRVGTLAADGKMYIWKENQWDELGCTLNVSSSSFDPCAAIGSWNTLGDRFKWSLIEVGYHVNANTANSSSLAFSFPWIPAGRYKFALATGISGANPDIVIAEQHTE